MNRRNFLRGLLALPLAPLAAKLLPKARTATACVDLAKGMDQTSIWLVSWGDNYGQVYAKNPFVNPSWKPGGRNWLKEKINGY